MTIQIPKRLFTVQEYHQLAQAGVFSEDDRLELLEGEIVEMAPIGSRHAACVDRLTQFFSGAVRESAIVRVQNPIRLSLQSEPQPDLALLQPRPDFYADAHPEPEDVLLVVEVAETSVGIDREVKLPLYAQAGIAEVWLVDLTAGCVEVYTRPSAHGYDEVRRYWRGDRLSPLAFPQVEVAVADILGVEAAESTAD